MQKAVAKKVETAFILPVGIMRIGQDRQLLLPGENPPSWRSNLR